MVVSVQFPTSNTGLSRLFFGMARSSGLTGVAPRQIPQSEASQDIIIVLRTVASVVLFSCSSVVLL